MPAVWCNSKREGSSDNIERSITHINKGLGRRVWIQAGGRASG